MTAKYPYDLLGGYWKVTLPDPGAPEIKGAAFNTYAGEWFKLNNTLDGVVFKARTDGGHTSGSLNPRSELRELNPDGSNASWSSTSGTHSMRVKLAVNALPIGNKPHVVIGQIHDAGDDVVVFRLEGNTSGDRSIGNLWITDGNTTHGHLLTDKYHLGDIIEIGFDVSGGVIGFVFNGQVVAGYTQQKPGSGWYFKTGSYNQSGGNCTKLTTGPDAGKCDYAEVTIYGSPVVCHNGVCWGGDSGVIVPTTDPNEPPAPPTPPVPPPLKIKYSYKSVSSDNGKKLFAKSDELFTRLQIPAPDVGITSKTSKTTQTITVDEGPALLARLDALGVIIDNLLAKG
jgi:hypothetical protein